MGELSPLIWKEWRDARRLVVGALVVSVIVAWCVHEFWFGYTYSKGRAEVLMPALLALFVSAIGSDLVSGDVATRRIETLAMLPVSVEQIWKAKIVFLALASAGFAIWIVLVEAVLTATFGPPRPVGMFLDRVTLAFPWFAAVLALGAAVTLFSTVLERGFASVLAGIATLGAFQALARSVNFSYYGVELLPIVWVPALLVLAAVFLAASRTAFVRGPIHHGRKVRVGALGMAVAIACLVPLGGGAAWALSSYRAVAPGLDTNHIRRMSCSPDGRYVAVEVTSTREYVGSHPRGLPRGDYARRVWIIDLESADLVEVPGRSTQLHDAPTPWDDDGNLRVWTRESTSVSQDGIAVSNVPLLKRTVDPATGETLEVAKIHREPRAGGSTTPGPQGRNVEWATVTRRGRVPGARGYRVQVQWHGPGHRSVTFGLPEGGYVVPSREPGIVFRCEADGTLRRYDMSTHEETVLLEVARPHIHGSPDGKRILTYDDSGCIAIDAKTGQRLGGPWGFTEWAHGFAGSRYVYAASKDGDDTFVTLIDLDTGRETRLEAGEERRRLCLAKPAENRIVTGSGAGPIVLRDLDGKTVRVLYGEAE